MQDVSEKDLYLPLLRELASADDGCLSTRRVRGRLQPSFPGKDLGQAVGNLTSNQALMTAGLIIRQIRNAKGEWVTLGVGERSRKGGRYCITPEGRARITGLPNEATEIPDLEDDLASADVLAFTIKQVPVEANKTETFSLSHREEVEAKRREAKLVQDFKDFIKQEYNLDTCRLQISIRGESAPLYTDIFIDELRVLVEAKGSTDRASFRMAVGQLADYKRFLPEPRCAILLPSRPNADLLELAQTERLEVFWQTNSGFHFPGR